MSGFDDETVNQPFPGEKNIGPRLPALTLYINTSLPGQGQRWATLQWLPDTLPDLELVWQKAGAILSQHEPQLPE